MSYDDDKELPDIGVHETFTIPGITIEAGVFERFRALLGWELFISSIKGLKMTLLQVRICARLKALLPVRCVIKFSHRPSIGPSLPNSPNQLLMLLTSAPVARAVSGPLLQKTWMGGCQGYNCW
jgi:hypothetical protein